MGMMVPLPVQRAMAVALSDEQHVAQQAQRYRARRSKLASALTEIGYRIDYSEAGLYIWCTNGTKDWDCVSWFADRGVIVTPGSFYGESGAQHIRIALTATDENIEAVTQRIAS
jgi:aspartate/methionine/tyrosine aminotransferase